MHARAPWPDREPEARLRLVRDDSAAHEGPTLRSPGVGGWSWTVLTKGVIWTRPLRRLYGVSDEAPASLDAFLALVHEDDRMRVFQRLSDAALRREACYDIEYRVVRPDGETRCMHARHVASYDIFGMPIQRAGMVLDVTDRPEEV